MSSHEPQDFVFWREHNSRKASRDHVKPTPTFLTEKSYYYLATPYAKLDREQAYEDACRMYALLLEKDIFVYCPIAQNHGSAKYISKENVESHLFWLHHDFKFLSIAKGLIVCKMPGWEESVGVAAEIEFAKKNNIPTFYTGYLEVPDFNVSK